MAGVEHRDAQRILEQKLYHGLLTPNSKSFYKCFFLRQHLFKLNFPRLCFTILFLCFVKRYPFQTSVFVRRNIFNTIIFFQQVYNDFKKIECSSLVVEFVWSKKIWKQGSTKWLFLSKIKKNFQISKKLFLWKIVKNVKVYVFCRANSFCGCF